jgi:hypothetical protein
LYWLLVHPVPYSTSLTEAASVRFGGAPCKGGVFQRVRVPPGKCSSRKLPEQLWR